MPAAGEPLAQPRRRGQRGDRGAERAGSPAEDAAAPVLDQLRGAARGDGHDGEPGGLGLEHDLPEGVRGRAEEEHVAEA